MSVIVLTGASQGIGAASALEFARRGPANLALVARSVPQLEEVASRCRDAGATATVFACDVTLPDRVQEVAGEILNRLGPPDIVINNAGSFRPGSFLDTDPETLRAQLDANLLSAYLVSRAFLPSMLEQERGHFVFLGSVASTRGYPGGVAYCIAKHAVLGLARALREETRERGIRVTTLLPGATWTPSWEGVDLPESRFIPAEDIARIIVDVTRLDPRSVVEEILVRPQLGDI